MKTALFRYAGFPIYPEMGAQWRGHGTKWAYWCIWDILKTLGYEVTLHDWNLPVPDNKQYDAVFSLVHMNGVDGACKDETIEIVRLSTAHSVWHNQQVYRRADDVNSRRGCELPAINIHPVFDDHDKHIERAHLIVLNGNEYVKQTYPQQIGERIVMMDVAAGNIRHVIYNRQQIPEERHFMWHGGHGAVHKGLDLCLEAFARHPEWTLHITGNLQPEPDFREEFQREMGLPNIHYHGWMIVSEKNFIELASRCFAFIFPSCSEGQSPAVATCLQMGLYPIISRQSGITLPDGCGLYLDSLTIEDVEAKAQQVMAMSDSEILDEIGIIQPDAIWRYSRERFRETMEKHLRKALGQ